MRGKTRGNNLNSFVELSTERNRLMKSTIKVWCCPSGVVCFKLNGLELFEKASRHFSRQRAARCSMLREVFFSLLLLGFVHADDVDILVSLFSATGGETWMNRTNWLDTSTDLSSWYGVDTDFQGRVTHLSLNGNNLTGSPPNMSGLEQLTSLNLSNNHLHAPADLFWSSLTDLIFLNIIDVSGNADLQDPPVCLPVNLTWLSISNTGVGALSGFLTSTPGSHCDLPGSRLKHFDCSHNPSYPIAYAENLYGDALEYVDFSHTLFIVEYVVPLLPNSVTSLSLNFLDSGSGHMSFPNLTRFHLTRLHLAGYTFLRTSKSDLSGLCKQDRLVDLNLSGSALSAVPPCIYRSLPNLEILDLSNNNLTGTLEISSMTMRELYVSNNKFGGILPDLNRLPYLSTLSAADNDFGGKIDPNYGSLISLILDNNHLRGNLPEFSKNIRVLSLTNNDMDGTLPSFESCRELKILKISNNSFVGSLPPTLFDVDLQLLYVGGNQLNGTLKPFSTSLMELELQSNQNNNFHSITGLPSNVLYVDLSHNQFDGPLPSVPSSVLSLVADDNRFSGKLPKIPHNIHSLSLGDNSFSDAEASDATWSDLPFITYLNLSMNRLTFLPKVTTHASLNILTYSSDYISSTALNGTDLSSVNTSTQTIYLYERISNLNLSNNLMTRWNDFYGRVLDISMNRLEAVPNIIQATYLNISHNRIRSGDFHTKSTILRKSELFNDDDSYLGYLQIFDARDNEIYVVGRSLSYATQLNYLDLSYNPVGFFYAEFSRLQNLATLLMSHMNSWNEPLSPTIGSILLLQTLDISGSNFVGRLPDSLGELAYLRHLNASNCGFSGDFPSTFQYNRYLRVLDMSNNNLTGGITDEMAAMISLKHMDLSGNQLNGTISSRIGTLYNLKHLDVSDNELTGHVPDLISSSPVLRVYNLSRNHLNGTVPKTISTMPNLSVLDFSSNSLSGRLSHCTHRLTLQSDGQSHRMPQTYLGRDNVPHHLLDEREIRVEGDVDSFDREEFVKQLSIATKISHRRLVLIYLRPGSVIVGLHILPADSKDISEGQASATDSVQFLLSRSLALSHFTVLSVTSGLHFPTTSHPSTTDPLEGERHSEPLDRGAIAEDIQLRAIQRDMILRDVIIEDQIGQGCFGEVYRGKWAGVTVALKCLKEEDTLEWLREASLLRKLNHPNIVRFLGTFSADHTTFMVLEFVECGAVDSFLRRPEVRDRIREYDLLCMTIEVVQGMCYLKMKGIIHRDLGARNLLVAHTDRRYHVKISDFGMSRESSFYESKDKQIAYKWSAPEVVHKVGSSSQSDVWSFGVTMWEIFSKGTVPYSTFTNQETVKKVFDENYRLDNPGCSVTLYDIILTCWNLDPQQRPTFEEILNILQKIASVEREDSLRSEARDEEQAGDVYAFGDRIVPSDSLYHASSHGAEETIRQQELIRNEMVEQCELCGDTDDLLRCQGCKKALYCSVEHQQIDWREHKKNCTKDTLEDGKKEDTGFTRRIQVDLIRRAIREGFTVKQLLRSASEAEKNGQTLAVFFFHKLIVESLTSTRKKKKDKGNAPNPAVEACIPLLNVYGGEEEKTNRSLKLENLLEDASLLTTSECLDFTMKLTDKKLTDRFLHHLAECITLDVYVGDRSTSITPAMDIVIQRVMNRGISSVQRMLEGIHKTSPAHYDEVIRIIYNGVEEHEREELERYHQNKGRGRLL
ncbi:hypothetical protein PROFUN_04188 [Planoprotostelium fungivorum]|uniref:Leucine-rich repeat receptor-like protein kinase n=1 Tax=Planoprotostelium fungivorum TaxID=1890364 RepID=A0A2P6NVV0_9EUKA|nr:hypothetical protein PROFUN_04188 [Planoprotostelium fungivorum]